MISKACIVGAYQRKLEEIAAYQDITLTVVVPQYWRENGRKLELERAHTQGYELIVTPMLFNGSFHAHFYPMLASILRRSRPDLCHIDEEPYNLATYLAMRVARRIGAKTLFFTWQNLLRRYPPPFRNMEGYVYRHTDGAIAGNHSAVQVLREKGYRGPVEIIPQFGVDPSLFAPRPPDHQRDERPFTIGFAGRLVPEKGLDLLLDAVAGLAGEWRLELYGAGPMRAALQAHAQTLGLAERVAFHDRVASSEMPERLAAMDVVVLPSLTRPNWKEQFGRVLIEAMSCGVPVIGSDSGEIPHVIGDGGWVFPEGDAAALRALLDRVRGEEAGRRAVGQRARARVLAHYTQAHIAAETVAFYRALCS
jgi:glycosyltransferase involved in cell wall biosynthesis